MSSAGVREGDLVGLSALLYTLRIHGVLAHEELFAACTAYGLRGGAVSWEAALKIGIDMQLVERAHQGLSLTPTGVSIGSLVAADLEPSDEFARGVLTFSIGRSASRFTLAHASLAGGVIQDLRGTAAPLLQNLAEVGLVVLTGNGDWQLQESEFSPLLIGLLSSAPKGTTVTAEVGNLGEKLTLKYYREEGWDPLHVSSISASYGFDVLCRQPALGLTSGSLAVEAKGTTAMGPYRFFASRHELRVAEQLGQRYEIALWGEIELTAPLDNNYDRLRSRGFPRIIRDPYGHVETHLPGLLSGRDILGGSVSADGLVWHLA